MLITEKRLRTLIKEVLNEVGLASSGGSSGVSSSGGETLTQQPQAKRWTDITNPGYTYFYDPSTGMMQILSTPKSKVPVFVNKNTQSTAYNAILAQFNSLQQNQATAPAPVTNVLGKAGFVIFARQPFFPLDAAARFDDNTHKPGWVSKIIDQGHGFAIVVKGDGSAIRYDFGRYPEAEKCPDPRFSAKLIAAMGLKSLSDMAGFITMGTALRLVCRVRAVFSKDGKSITNLKQFLAGTTKPNDAKTDYVIVPVSDVEAASAYAQSKSGKCVQYAIPGFQAINIGETLNCGIFAYYTIQAGKPVQPFNAEIRSLIDSPTNLYQELVGSGLYQTA